VYDLRDQSAVTGGKKEQLREVTMSLEKDSRELKSLFEAIFVRLVEENSAYLEDVKGITREIEALEATVDQHKNDPGKVKMIIEKISQLKAKIKADKAKVSEGGTEVAEPTTEPATTPAEPTKKPSRPNTPLRPTPGIQPKPKASNHDVELFLQKRGLAEGSEAFSGSIWGNRPVPKCYKCGGKTYKDEADGNNKCTACKQAVSYCTCGQNESVEFGAEYRAEWREAAKNLKNKLEESKINEAPFTGVHPAKKKWIETGDEQLNQIMPELSPEEQTYLQTIASDTYAETVQKIEDCTGIKVKPSTIPRLYQLLVEALWLTKQIESTNKKYLEELAMTLVFSVPEFKIVEEAYMNEELGFDLKIDAADLSKLKKPEQPEEDELSSDEELNLGLATVWKDETDEDLRRKFANLMITGGSVNKLYLFNMATEKLARIDAKLPIYYSVLASVAQLGYWISPFGFEQMAAGGGDTSAGSEEVIPQGDKYIIKARGITFPYLVHELVKGIYEWLALDPSQQVAMQKDKLEDETKDMIAGPGVFKTIASYIPADKQEILPLIQKKTTGLRAEEIRNVLAKNPEGQRIMRQLIDDAEKEWGTYQKQKEEYQA